MRVGIIGYGSFGALLAAHLAPHVSVLVYDQQPLAELPQGVQHADLAAAAACPVVIIAVPLTAMTSIAQQLAALVTAETVVMDVCSVKMRPAQIMQDWLGGKCRLLATHPLFGPSSVAANHDSLRDFTMVWHELADGPFPELEALFGDTLGLQLQRLTPEVHDREMAWVHALTFFVGRALLDMNIPAGDLDTGYYQKLRALAALERTHSRELFNTIEAGNPYAAAVRQQLIATMQQLDRTIQELPL